MTEGLALAPPKRTLRTAVGAVALAGLMALPLAAASDARASGPVLLFDVETGHVLYASQPDQPWHPASLTKIMTAYLAFEALKSGQLKDDEPITTSETAHKMPPSKIGLPVGAEMSIDLALRSLIIKSANDVAVMIAEAIDGSVPAFAERMNRTARRLGMTETHFENPSGLPDPAQVTSARDMAKLTRAVIAEHPKHAHYWATPTMRIGRIRLRSHNTLLRNFAGASGIKTGFICDSGFNVVASARRDGRHLGAVVLGEVSARDRGARAQALLDHGFETYAWKRFLDAPTLASLTAQPDTVPVPSVRNSIKSWNCKRRRARPKQKPTARNTPPRQIKLRDSAGSTPAVPSRRSDATSANAVATQVFRQQ